MIRDIGWPFHPGLHVSYFGLSVHIHLIAVEEEVKFVACSCPHPLQTSVSECYQMISSCNALQYLSCHNHYLCLGQVLNHSHQQYIFRSLLARPSLPKLYGQDMSVALIRRVDYTNSICCACSGDSEGEQAYWLVRRLLDHYIAFHTHMDLRT